MSFFNIITVTFDNATVTSYQNVSSRDKEILLIMYVHAMYA